MNIPTDIIVKALPNSRRVLVMWDRPGGPPGNGHRDATDAEQAEAIVAALDAAGFVVVPREPTAEIIAHAAPRTGMPSTSAYSIAARASKLLPTNDHPDVADVLAQMVEDYRAMVEARPK